MDLDQDYQRRSSTASSLHGQEVDYSYFAAYAHSRASSSIYSLTSSQPSLPLEQEQKHQLQEEEETQAQPRAQHQLLQYHARAQSESAPPPLLSRGHRSSSSQLSTSSLTPAALVRASIPSFSAFRSQASTIPRGFPSRPPAKGSSHHGPSISLSAAVHPSPRLVEPSPRPRSADVRFVPERNSALGSVLPPLQEDIAVQPQTGSVALNTPFHRESRIDRLTRNRASSTYPLSESSHGRSVSTASPVEASELSSPVQSPGNTSSIPIHTRYASEDSLSHLPTSSISNIPQTLIEAPLDQHPAGGDIPTSGMTTLQLQPVQRTSTNESLGVESNDASRPKSPAGRLGSFFGWRSASPKSASESPSTAFSERSMSPLPSPQVDKPLPAIDQNKRPSITNSLEIPSNGRVTSSYFDGTATPGSNASSEYIKELERELSQVSAELAASIRREMDLEDDLERIRVEGVSIAPSENGRRGSDYFSDSGYSSVRFPITDYDSKMEQLERNTRKAEQEKANIKLEMASRLQTELSRRHDLEQMVQSYEQQLQKTIEGHSSRDMMEERVEGLETTLEDTRRLLKSERQAKGSFEELYSATRGELEQQKNERDNLRDEVVPALKARVEGLESEAAEKEALAYENARMQQELSQLRSMLDGRYGTIAEEDGLGMMGVSRSGSTRNHSKRGGSLTRNGSVRDNGRQRSGSASLPVTAENMKEIEDQRDALHKALKLLISRHEKQRKDHERAIKKLNTTRAKAEVAAAKSPYQKEVFFLKEEVTTLRKRTEDALEQKYQYEKNLAGIKMDLDRAEQETRELRNLLQQQDINAPSPSIKVTFNDEEQKPYADELSISISKAESERDSARQAAEQYRERAKSASGDAATELVNSAKRMDELADQLDGQVQANTKLRRRLTDAVAKGENEQRESGAKIEEMQKRLAGLEDSVIAAQQHSETTLGTHEADVRKIEEATSPSLQRLTIKIPSSSTTSSARQSRQLQAPASPALLRSPTRGPLASKRLADASLLEASRTHMLERKVRELEGLLREAEQDMQDVVQRVNTSQLEVAELQTERDAAVSTMRKLQSLVLAEREKAEKWQ